MFEKECCKHFRHVKFKGIMTKWPVQKQTHRTTQKHVTTRRNIIKKQQFFCLSDFYFYV